MPELPDIVVYIEALERRMVDRTLVKVRVTSPFLLRTTIPPIGAVQGKTVRAMRRLGKRIAIGLEDDLWLVLHLMVAGRLHWAAAGVKLSPKHALAAFDFPDGALMLTEAGAKKRASLHLVKGERSLRDCDPGGLEVLDASLEKFTRALTSHNHTLKRALTDPRLLSGIGNSYSDEILHQARLSPVAMTQKLAPDEIRRLHEAARETLVRWIEILRREAGESFPEGVTAFREGFAVHGKFGKPCPQCGTRVQRIRYADRETNYCPRCQTGGRLLADRSLSLLLKNDWPRTIEELEDAHGPLSRNRPAN
ncbi:MAG: formamidopyrimidine-DNA glycosylase [Verrucomicrobia bacterium]|nr:formamidopyrimidine-DNA glycosylase [Verrucomicrobiota bacterium]